MAAPAAKPLERLMLRSLLATLFCSVFFLLLSGCGGSSSSSAPDFVNAARLGGDTTQENTSQSSHAFSSPAANLTPEQLDLHNTGDANFEQAFITAPSTDFPNLDGLGPVFNNSHCEGCHQRDSRGTPPIANGVQFENFSANESMLLRISLAGSGGADCEPLPDNNYCAPTAVPGFGTQLFNRGVLNARTDANFTGVAKVAVRYLSHQVTLNGGEVITLRAPEFQISSPYDAPDEPLTGVTPSSRLLQSDVRISARVGSPVFGLGLIEAISAADILANADPDDSNGDGISGRANYVFDPSAGPSDAPVALGRFGWKANTPSVYVQALGALHDDMGVTNELFTTESIAGTPFYDDYQLRHPDDIGMNSNGEPEAGPDFTDPLVFYVQTLNMPMCRAIADPKVRQGAGLFASTGLADQRTDFLADGNEWRTPPLWGIGLTKT